MCSSDLEAPAAFRRTGVEALLVDQTSFGGSTVAESLDLPFISICCALMINRDPQVPPFNTSWSYHQTWWAGWRNQLGYRLIDLPGLAQGRWFPSSA